MAVAPPAKLAKVKLVGTDGNTFALVARCMNAGRKAKYTPEQLDAFKAEVFSGDYDHALQTMCTWFEVS